METSNTSRSSQNLELVLLIARTQAITDRAATCLLPSPYMQLAKRLSSCITSQ